MFFLTAISILVTPGAEEYLVLYGVGLEQKHETFDLIQTPSLHILGSIFSPDLGTMRLLEFLMDSLLFNHSFSPGCFETKALK